LMEGILVETENSVSFCTTICKTICPLLSDCCLSVLSCPVCLPETLVYCGQMVGWIKMKLDMEVGLGPDHIVLDGDSAPPKKEHSPQFSAHVYCGQTVGLIKMPLGMEVGLGSGDIMLDGDPAPSKEGHSTPTFSAHVYCGQTVDGSRCHLIWR